MREQCTNRSSGDLFVGDERLLIFLQSSQADLGRSLIACAFPPDFQDSPLARMSGIMLSSCSFFEPRSDLFGTQLT